MGKTRFHPTKFRHLQGVVAGIIREVAHHHLTHDDLFRLREERLWSHPDWMTLPHASRAELDGMLRGAVEAWYVSQLEWCHFYQGRYVPSEVFHQAKVPYSAIDPNQSARVWRGTQKRFSGVGTIMKDSETSETFDPAGEPHPR